MDAYRLLSVSVTPVVLISACGLITLALYNRLNSIVARIRAFQQEKVGLLAEMGGQDEGKRSGLLVMVDTQIARVTAKAKAIQKSLYCLLCAVLAFLVCCVLSAAVALHESVGVVLLTTHVAGLLLFVAGVGWALRELTLSLSPLEEESAYLETLSANRDRPSRPERQSA
jgi:hypothetical protein